MSRYPRHVHVFVFESLVMTLAFYALMAVKVWAFVDALIRPAPAYVANQRVLLHRGRAAVRQVLEDYLRESK